MVRLMFWLGVGSSGGGDAVFAGAGVWVGGTAVSVTVGVNVGGNAVGMTVGSCVATIVCVGKMISAVVGVMRAKATVSPDLAAEGAAAGSGRCNTPPNTNSNSTPIRIVPKPFCIFILE